MSEMSRRSTTNGGGTAVRASYDGVVYRVPPSNAVNANNPYYQHYEEVHKALAKKLNVSKLTIAEMGGLECAKCHY